LVLDWVDSSERSPVLGGNEVFDWENGWFSFLNVLWGSVTEKFLVLVMGPGGHEVVSNGEGVVLVSVDFSVFNSLGIEEGLSEGVFFSSSVGKSVLSNVVKEVDGGVLLFLADVFESKGHGGFAERSHL
jgi:hypothetical protein